MLLGQLEMNFFVFFSFAIQFISRRSLLLLSGECQTQFRCLHDEAGAQRNELRKQWGEKKKCIVVHFKGTASERQNGYLFQCDNEQQWGVVLLFGIQMLSSTDHLQEFEMHTYDPTTNESSSVRSNFYFWIESIVHSLMMFDYDRTRTMLKSILAVDFRVRWVRDGDEIHNKRILVKHLLIYVVSLCHRLFVSSFSSSLSLFFYLVYSNFVCMGLCMSVRSIFVFSSIQTNGCQWNIM